MARDLMRMLTEITPTQQPTSAVPGTPGFRGMFGQQQAQRLQGSLGSLARGGAPSPQARMQQALSGLDLNKPEDLAKLAKIQQGTGDFAGAAQTAAKIKALRTQEAKTDAEDRYKVVGNNVLDITTGKYLPPPPGTEKGGYTVSKIYDPERGANVVQFLDKNDPTKVLREVLDVVDTKEETATITKIRKQSLDSSFKAATDAREATRVANEFEKVANQISSGILATAEEQVKALAGLQDETTLLRLSANRLRLGRAIENLPQGPATDKDVKLVLAGELPDNASPETIVSYARGLAKLARREQEYFNKEVAWLDLYDNQKGFSAQMQKEALEETLASIPAGAIAELEANPTPQNIQFFNQTFGVDYSDITEKLELANRTLTKLKRGF